MEKIVGTLEIRRKLSSILQMLLSQGDTYIVERQGEPVAAVVPFEVYEQWKRSRASFFEILGAAQAQADVAPEEAERLAAEAVEAARVSPK